MKAMEKKTVALGTKNKSDDAAALELMATPISETCANNHQICGEFEIYLKVYERKENDECRLYIMRVAGWR